MKRIESKNNPNVKRWRKLHTKKGRDETGQFWIEGYHLIEEALKSGIQAVDLIVREKTDIPGGWNFSGLSVYKVTEDVFNHISDTETPQGVAAVCRKPSDSPSEDMQGRYLFIDGVQDPGNVGTMIRTADAAGITAVILGKGCVDPYNGKVLRGTQGSLFHLPVVQGDLHKWVDSFKERGVTVFGTALEDAKPYTAISSFEHFAVIVGNEGGGVDPSLLEKTDERLYIPIYGKAESLNVSVATGILLYGLRKA